MLFTRTDYQSQYDTYHSSADNYDYYSNVAKQDEIIGDKVQVVGAAVMAFDDQLIQPVNYESYFNNLSQSIDSAIGDDVADNTRQAVEDTAAMAKKLDEKISEVNVEYGTAVATNNKAKIAALKKEKATINKKMFALYKQFQKDFTRLDHDGTVVAPHEAYQNNLAALEDAAAALDGGNLSDAISNLCMVDSNGLAPDFSRQTYNQSVAQKTGTIGRDKMAWGLDMIDEDNQNLYKVVTSLIEKESQASPSLEYEKGVVADAIDDQRSYLVKMLNREVGACLSMVKDMNAIFEKL